MSAPEYLDDRALAARLGLARITLQVWRSQGKGPPYFSAREKCPGCAREN